MNWTDRDRRISRSRSQIRQDIEDELAFHVEMRTSELIDQGLDPAAAREEALRRIGNLEEVRRSCERIDARSERRFAVRALIEEIGFDLGQTVRGLRRRPAIPAILILILALAIGAATTIFSIADHVLFRPLPYPDVDRIVTLWELDLEEGERQRVSPGNWSVWAESSGTLESIGLAEPSGRDLRGDGHPEALRGWLVTQGWLESLGVTPLVGRPFEAADFETGGEPVVLISHELWARKWGLDPSILGKRVTIDDRPTTIIGVLPRWLTYPDRRDVVEPMRLSEAARSDRRSAYMHAVARLAPGVSVDEARADLRRIAATMRGDYPDTNARIDVELMPLREEIVGSIRPALVMLLGAVALLLLIAAANAAGLMLTRARDRRTEIAIRSSLGATQWRLIRQLLVETVLLASLAGTAGLFFAWAGTRFIRILGPADLPRIETVGIDARIVLAAVAVSFVVALLVTLGPAIQTVRSRIGAGLGSGARSTAGRAAGRLRTLLVVSEIAITLILLIGSGLLVRSFLQLVSNDLGFETENRVSMQAFLWDRNPTPEQRRAKVEEFIDHLSSVPGVRSAGAVSALPFHPHSIDASSTMTIEGRPAPADPEETRVNTTIATGSYFETMGIPLVGGRLFDRRDDTSSTQVALISERLAASFFPDGDAIGSRITIGVMGPAVPREVIGIVGDVRPEGYDSAPKPELFIPYSQSQTGHLTLVVETTIDEAAMLPRLQTAFWNVDPQQTIYLTATVEALTSSSVERRRFELILLGGFAILSLILAMTGIYTLIAFAVRHRSREMGIRMALGSTAREVVSLMLREGAKLAIAGIAIGAAVSLVVTRFLRGMLYEVAPSDPATYLQLAALVFVIALIATWVPARRAAAIDPARTLTEP